jgi:Trk K+ transport system NAD-binding subunit/Kef-type K+ transport system membrane component KefB/mannitol/fructose-specific phosphotransferase system IIA component (Ntr-type)
MVETSLISISYIIGFLIVALASRQIGDWFAVLKLPLITGFLFVGIVAGPYVLNIIPAHAIHQLKFIDELSLAYIAFSAGSELVVRQIKSRFKAIRYVTVGLVLSTFFICSFAFFLLSEFVPFIKAMPPVHRAAGSLLVGAIMVARSPSSAIAVVNELRAKGPFTKTALGVTVIMEVVVIILFSISESIAGTILTDVGFDLKFILILFVELSLTVISGYLFSYLLRFILSMHCNKGLKTIFIMAAGLVVFVIPGLFKQITQEYLSCGILLEPLLICMLAGFLTANYSTYRTELIKVLHDIGPFVYIAFFTLTGASLRLDVLTRCWVIALALFGFRLAAIFIGSFNGGLFAGEPMKDNKIAWMCYITQAGVGLGLAKQVSNQFPGWGEVLATIIIAVIVLNQIVGPPFFKWALYLVKEAKPRIETQSSGDIRDAIIFGLEGESLALARLLQSNDWEVKIATNQVQYDKSTAASSDIEIHPIPDLNLNTLNKLGIGHADSIVSMLSDEENYKICELVHENFGIHNFIVRLNQHAYYKRFHELGAIIVEPRTAIVNLLNQFVRSPSAARLLLGLEEGREIFEFELRNPDFKGIAIRDLHLPLDLHILSIRRDGQLIISVGFTRLQIGDWLTVVGSRTSLEQMMLQLGENQEDALVSMVDITAAKSIYSQRMDKEVKTLIHDSDAQKRARFNRLIDESTVLDLPSSITYDLFFHQAADAVSTSLDVSKEYIFKLLMEREKESSTAFRPDLAIPHIIIDGQNMFHLLLARCKEGIFYSELAPKVRAVFLLVGTSDQRDFHLYALASIAEVVQQTYFHERWLKAKNKTALRNMAKTKKTYR